MDYVARAKKFRQEITDLKAQNKQKDMLISKFGEEIANSKLKNMQKDQLINNLGEQITHLKLDIMLLKGGGK